MMNTNFTEIKSKYIPCENSFGSWFKHKKTGLQIFHFKCNSAKNYFRFVFNTPADDRYGTSHIVEHLIYRGSEKYPVDMMNNLINSNSLNYTNGAYVGSGISVHMAGSYIKKDYFNLLEVYGDALFFPRLEKYAFYQEACHLELNENDELFLNGITYNEEKFSKNIKYAIILEALKKAGLGDSAIDSILRDNLYIPEISYERTIEYYKKYYTPANCILILYNSYSIYDQLDFIEEKILSRFPTDIKFEVPVISPMFQNIKETKFESVNLYSDKEKPNEYLYCIRIRKHPKNIRDDGLIANFFSLILSKDNENNIAELLKRHDVAKKIEANVITTKNSYLFFISFSNLKIEDQPKLIEIINNCFRELCNINLDKNIIKKCLSYLYEEGCISDENEISDIVMDGYLYGDLFAEFDLADDINSLIKQFESNYMELAAELIPQYFINNTERVMLTLKFDLNYFEKRAVHEKKIIQKLFQNTSKEEILKNMTYMEAKQAKYTTNEVNFPTINKSDLISKDEISHVTYDYPFTSLNYLNICTEDDFETPDEYIEFGKSLFRKNTQNKNFKIKTKTPVSNMLIVLKTAPIISKNHQIENILIEILLNTELFRILRLMNNAYVVDATYAAISPYITFYTMMDPNPAKSQKIFFDVLRESCSKKFTENEIRNLLKIHNFRKQGLRIFDDSHNNIQDDEIFPYIPGFDISKITSEDLNKAAKNLIKRNPNPRTVFFINNELKITNQF